MIRSNYLKITILFTACIVCLYFTPYKLKFIGFHYAKIGAHKCNTVSKMRSASYFYNFIELDLHYNANLNKILVYHTDDEPSHLTLDTYLSKILNRKTFFWLDFKNLEASNSKLIYDSLFKVLSKHNVAKDQVLIESTDLYSLSLFSENDFECTFYINDKLWKQNDQEIHKIIKKTQHLLNQNSKVGISFDYLNYDFLKNTFPDRIKFVWNLTRFPLAKITKTREILNDQSVKIMLTSFNYPG